MSATLEMRAKAEAKDLEEVLSDDEKTAAFAGFAGSIGIDYFKAKELLPGLWKKAKREDAGRVGYPDIAVMQALHLVAPDEILRLIDGLPPLDLWATLVYLGGIPDRANDWRSLLR